MGISKRKPVFRVDPDSAEGPSLPEVLTALRARGSEEERGKLANYGIPDARALGVPMREIQALADEIGRDHGLACGLWVTRIHEARLLAAFVEEADAVTPAQMDTWAREFDNWAVVDTLCFHLFDRTPHAWAKAEEWCSEPQEYVRRAGLALVWALTVHDKIATDSAFVEALRWINAAADDPREMVKKAADMALRAVGKRNATLHRAALALADRLAESEDPNAAWIGRHAGKELRGASVQRRLGL